MNYKQLLVDSLFVDVTFTMDANYFSFFSDNDSRPDWSIRLNDYLVSNNIDLNMNGKYINYLNSIISNRNLKKIYSFINEKEGIKVDLASGPSGFFYPIVVGSNEKDIVIVTDACKWILNEINKTCQKDNFFIFDIDLDLPLPFKDNTICAFSSNLLSNCVNYMQTIKEVYRCLESKGRFVVIEWFYEDNKKTSKYLENHNQITASTNKYIKYLEGLGFKHLETRLMKTKKGRLNGDLFPLDENELVYEKALFFEKE